MVSWSLTHDLSTSIMDGISKIGKRFIMYSSQVKTIVPVNPFAVKINFLSFCLVQSRGFLFIVPFDFEEINLVNNFTLYECGLSIILYFNFLLYNGKTLSMYFLRSF